MRGGLMRQTRISMASLADYVLLALKNLTQNWPMERISEKEQ
jgi:hypothetical protein